MARKLDLAQLRQAKKNQFVPGAAKEETIVAKEVAPKKEVKEKTTIAKKKVPKDKQPTKKSAGKAGRPINHDKKPTRATSIRIHPDLVEVPKILAGLSRKNVFSFYNEIIVEALIKYKKKYPGMLDDIKIPPKEEI